MADNRDRALEILAIVTDWAKSHEDIRGIALVGSHARGAARPDSDIDVVMLSKDPKSFRDAAWLTSVEWSRAGVHVTTWADEEYGAVWSRRAWFEAECEVEFAFACLSWADVSPVDHGTARVMADGCRILYDPDGLLKRLILAVASLKNFALEPPKSLPCWKELAEASAFTPSSKGRSEDASTVEVEAPTAD